MLEFKRDEVTFHEMDQSGVHEHLRKLPHIMLEIIKEIPFLQLTLVCQYLRVARAENKANIVLPEPEVN